jgi:hypothetical protein
MFSRKRSSDGKVQSKYCFGEAVVTIGEAVVTIGGAALIIIPPATSLPPPFIRKANTIFLVTTQIL